MVVQLIRKSRPSLPIRLKIFGVATSMLTLLLGVTYVNHQNIRHVNHELIDLADYLTPLNKNLAEIAVHAYEQEIHFERVVRYYAMEDMGSARIQAEVDVFKARALKVTGEIAAARSLAEIAEQSSYLPEDRRQVARLQAFLDVIKTDHEELERLSRKTMGKLAAGDWENAILLNNQLSELEDIFDARVQSILSELADFVEASAIRAQAHEESTLQVSWGLAAIASSIGLVFASLVTAGLIRPVRRLVAQTHAVEQGNLDVTVPIESTDEIGQLTRSFNAMVRELREKERLKQAFGQYVDPRIVATLVEQQQIQNQNGPNQDSQSQDSQTPIGQSQMMTLFFSDMAGFSGISELLTATGLVNLINHYLTLASAPIQAHHGVVNQFIGDAVSAFWGPPFVSPEDHAKLACYAALEQFDQLAKLRRALPELMGIRKGLPEINIRIGLASGQVVAGSIGSDNSKSYTVMGPAVQIAEALEGLSKVYGTRILITAMTKQLAGDSIETREVDRRSLAPGSEAEPIYELLGIAGNTGKRTLVLRDRFQTSLADYRAQRWQAAADGFQACLQLMPKDGPSQYYLKQLRSHLKARPIGVPTEPAQMTA